MKLAVKRFSVRFSRCRCCSVSPQCPRRRNACVAAIKLPVRTAANKSFLFAKNTGSHDSNCVRYGVENCRRISLHVVFCRIFDERDTAAQGKYTCDKLIRVAVDLSTYRVLVTGNGPYHCS